MGTYDSFRTIKGKALVVTVAALQHMEAAKRPLKGKEFLEPVQTMLAAFELPPTKMVFVSNVLSKLADAGHIFKTPTRLYFINEAQAAGFNAWLTSPAYRIQLTENLAGVREYYRLKAGGEEKLPTLEELRAQVAGEQSTVDPAPAIPAVFGYVPGGRVERSWEAGYERSGFTRAYVPMGWAVTFTSPRGQDFRFDVTTGRLIRLSDGKSKKVYAPRHLG